MTKPPLDLTDISGTPYGERLAGFFRQVMRPESITHEGVDLAHRMVVEEMMNEQHTMLMAICDKLGIKVG